MCDNHASYLQLHIYIQASNDFPTRSFLYYIIHCIVLLPSLQHRWQLIPKYVHSSAQLIYHIALIIRTLQYFSKKYGLRGFLKTDAWIFDMNLPNFGFSAVCVMDIRTRHPKKTTYIYGRIRWHKKTTDGHRLQNGNPWPSLLHHSSWVLDSPNPNPSSHLALAALRTLPCDLCFDLPKVSYILLS